MPFPQNFLDELLARSDIVDIVGSYVSLTPKGGSYWGCCPFHNEKTPSFHVLPDKQFYHCFGCKKGGGVVNFVMEMEGLTYPDAIRFLAKRANLPVPEESSDGTEKLRSRMLALNRDAARYYYSVLQSQEGAAVQAYLDKRRIRRGIAVRFGMGAAPDSWDALLTAMTHKGYTKQELISAGLAVNGKNGRLYDKFRNRLMLPVIDVRGDVVGFGSRVLDKSEPKYMNTPETLTYSKRRILYGMNLAKKSKRSNIILCEGNLDVVTLHQAGFDNAVASMGTALTQEQLRLLSRYTKELVLCYDNDNAGQQATRRALELLNNSEFSVKVLQLPRRLVDGEYIKQDADDFIKLQGPAAFERLLTGSENGVEFRLDQIAGKYDLTDDTQRIAYAQEVSEELAKHDAGFTISNNSYSFGLSAILADGTEAQKQAACARILRGEGISMAITEPQSGSDVGSTRTSAKKVDGGYVLNGVKCFITNATLCSACVVLAVTNPDAGYHGMSLLLVEKSDAGVSVGKHEDKLGIRLSDTADFVMEDVFVPADRLIGTEGNGFAQTMKFLAGKRPVSVAGAVGVAQRALDLAVDYARERSFKHGPIAKLEGIQFLIADMEMRIQASRAMAVYGAQMTDAGIPIGTLGNSLKCFASEMCYDVVNMGLQVFAGYGYSREYPLEKLLRDARIYSIFEGTNQVQRQVIGKTLLG